MNLAPDIHLQLARLGAQIEMLQHTVQEVLRHSMLLHADGDVVREKLLARDQYLALEAAIREQELRDSPALRALYGPQSAEVQGSPIVPAPVRRSMRDRARRADRPRSRGASDSAA